MTSPSLRRAAVLLLSLAAAAAPASAEDEAGGAYTGADLPADARGYFVPPRSVATTVELGRGEDDAFAVVDLPFEFPWFGQLEAQATISSNGWLGFGALDPDDDDSRQNASLPSSAAPDGIVAALWDDLTTGKGSVRTFTLGESPARTFVVWWQNVRSRDGRATNLSFQVHLSEATGTVDLVYRRGSGDWRGLSYTAGIEDPSGTLACGSDDDLGNRRDGAPPDWRFTPTALTLGGTLVRDELQPDAAGALVAAEDVPVVGAHVELVNAETGKVATRGDLTKADGSWSIRVLGATTSTPFRLAVLASGVESKVVDNGQVHRHVFADAFTFEDDAASRAFAVDAGVDATAPAFRKALNVQQAARLGFDWARDATATASGASGRYPALDDDQLETFPVLDLRLTPGVSGPANRSAYTPKAGDTAAFVTVHDGGADTDAWDDDVILRECGLHVLATVSSVPSSFGTRSWETATTAPVAWADGFAHWFACVVQGDPRFIDTKGAAAPVILDLEAATPAPARGTTVTGAVASSLWDVTDAVAETWDALAANAVEVFRTVDRGLDATREGGWVTSEFLDAWAEDADEDEVRATARIFLHHGAVADDAREPADDSNAPSALATTRRVDQLVLNAGDEDLFTLDFVPSADGRLSVAVAPSLADAEVELVVLDDEGAEVARGTSAVVDGVNRVQVTSAAPLAAGTYTVRVAWSAGPRTDYSLAWFEPLLLRVTSRGVLALEVADEGDAAAPRAALPGATEDNAYAVTFAAAGGIPPYTLTTTSRAPGVVPLAGGAGLTGTASRADEEPYDVDVVVRDQSGAGRSFPARLSLLVLPELRLREFVGVAAETDVDGVDLGVGGTGTTWTTAFTADGGLAVVSTTPTLRLAGDAGNPRTFVVRASAQDDAGAVWGASDAQVVVAAALPESGTAPVPQSGTGETLANDAFFGWGFDALAGSSADLRFRFRLTGGGDGPQPVAVVHESGVALETRGLFASTRSTVHVRVAELAATGRWFVLFERGQALATSMSVRGSVAPPREVHGVVVFDEPDATGVKPEEVRFDALGGSRVRMTATPVDAPGAAVPTIETLVDPEGGTVPSRGPGASARSATLPAGRDGTYVVTIAATATGPVLWRVRIAAPRRRSWTLF